jgi:integrase
MSEQNGRVNLTKKFVEDITPPKQGRNFTHDTRTRGLSVCVRPGGHRSFLWQRKAQHGRPIWRMVGIFPETTVDQARDRAEKLNHLLSEWKAANFPPENNPFARSPRGKMSFGDLLEKYIEKRIRLKAVNPAKAEKYTRWMVGKYLAPWRGRKLDQITKKDVRELHDQIGRENGQVMADRVAQLVRRIFYWAMSGKVELWSAENPAAKVEFYGYKKCERFLQPDELVRLDRALKEEPSGDLRDFVELALATGARKSNVLAMQWAELSEPSTGIWIWTITKTKTGKRYVLPLTPRAIEVIKRRSPLRQTSPWVFPSELSASGHFEEPKRAWAQLLKRAGISDFTIHSLRRTNASYQAISGQTLQAIAATLGHASTASTEIYAKLNADVARKSLLAGADAMERAMVAVRKRAVRRG